MEYWSIEKDIKLLAIAPKLIKRLQERLPCFRLWSYLFIPL